MRGVLGNAGKLRKVEKTAKSHAEEGMGSPSKKPKTLSFPSQRKSQVSNRVGRGEGSGAGGLRVGMEVTVRNLDQWALSQSR